MQPPIVDPRIYSAFDFASSFSLSAKNKRGITPQKRAKNSFLGCNSTTKGLAPTNGHRNLCAIHFWDVLSITIWLKAPLKDINSAQNYTHSHTSKRHSIGTYLCAIQLHGFVINMTAIFPGLFFNYQLEIFFNDFISKICGINAKTKNKISNTNSISKFKYDF